jgi:hypothetical protein
MADWQTVRFDPTYEEPLDPELIPLLDALNDAGFVTISSCSGHGSGWPHISFAHSDDARIERLARFVMATEAGDYRPYFSMWQKEILLAPHALSHGHAYIWSVELHLNHVDGLTPQADGLREAVKAINATATQVARFRSEEKGRV